MVKNACTCTTSEARPGEICDFIAMNSNPNCPAPISTPYAARCDHGTAGRFRTKISGKATKKKRKVAKKSGGRWPSAILMTTKFVPHTSMTASVRSAWAGVRAERTCCADKESTERACPTYVRQTLSGNILQK